MDADSSPSMRRSVPLIGLLVPRLALALAVLAVWALSPAPAHAQPQDPAPQGTPAPASAVNPAAAQEIRIEIERFGVGSMVRPGEWAGIRVRFIDAAPRQREIMLRLHARDQDGDTALLQRELTSNPGVWQSTWLYLRLPPSFQSSDALLVTAHEALPAPEDAPPSAEISASGFIAGRLLATATAAPAGLQSLAEPTVNLLAIVGTGSFGLNQYSIRLPGGDPWSPMGHELLQVVQRLEPAEFPDRWQGLAQYAVLVWAAADPAELRGERSRALRHWVERGGHLVVILPPVGQSWTNREANELADLLPAVRIERREGVDLAPLRPLLTSRPDAPLPKSAVIHTLTPLPDATTAEAAVLFTDPDARPIVARRLVGAGAVTLIGIDLTQRALAEQDAVEADQFWNRVLGRRGLIPSTVQLNANPQSLGGGVRTRVRFDSEIAAVIAKTGRSAAGVLLGLFLFAIYWLLAGPLGWAGLKRSQRLKHSWIAFVLTAAAFTAVAWGGATLLRPGRPEGTHLTLLDHVYGQPVQRARLWASLLVPRYGDAAVTIDDDPSRPYGSNLLSPFEPAWSDQRSRANFPDARIYTTDTRSPDSLRFPARSTVKQIQADWAGPPQWGMIRPLAPQGSAEAPRITLDESRRPRGILVHELPAPLEHAVLVVVSGQRPLNVREPLLTAEAAAYKLSDWAPGQPLDLSILTQQRGGAASIEKYLEDLVQTGRVFNEITSRIESNTGNLDDQLTALAFFPLLAPPDFSLASASGRPASVAQRAATVGWDIARWFTQPCIIIVGHVGASTPAPAPVPLKLDANPAPLAGRTVVRWIYPLDASPPRYPNPAEKAPAAPAATPDPAGGY